MGNPAIQIEEDDLADLLARGCTYREIASIYGTSPAVITRRVSAIRSKEKAILDYRSVQSLELTELQQRILMNITPEKIAEANLRDLVGAFKILKENERLLDGKPTELKGLVGYLIQLEKEEADALIAAKNGTSPPTDDEDIQDAEFVVQAIVSDSIADEVLPEGWLPDL